MTDLATELYGLDPHAGMVSNAILNQESGNNPNSPTSIDGAVGRAQITPATFKQYALPGEDINNPADNLAVHNRIIADLSQKANGDPARIAVGYFSGPGNIAPAGSPTPYKIDKKDGNGKTVSSYAADVLNRLNPVPSANAAEPAKPVSGDDLANDLYGSAAPQPQAQPMSKFAAAIQGGAANVLGGTRIGAALGSWPALFTDKTVSQAYSENLKRLQNYQNDAMEQHPGYYLGGLAATALATGGATAETGVGSALGDLLRTGNIATRAGKAGAVGATSGALYGAGAAPEGEMAQGATQGALVGGALGAAAPAVGSVAKSIFASKAVPVAAADLRALASQSFKTADAAGGTLAPKITDSFIDDASKVLPQSSAAKLVMGDTPTTQLVDRMQALRGQPLSLQAAQEIDSALGDLAESHVDPKTGKLLKEGAKFIDIQHSLRDSIKNASASDIAGGKAGFDALDNARQLWAASARANDIERIINKADGADNPATVIKNGFRSLKNNPTRMRGFTDEEKAAIQSAAKTGLVTGALKVGGSRLISGLVGATAGGLGGGPVGAIGGALAGEAAAYPMRAAATALQTGRANNVLSKIAERPVVQQASPALAQIAAQPTNPLFRATPSSAVTALQKFAIQKKQK